MLAASVGVVLPGQPCYIRILKNDFVEDSDSQHASLTTTCYMCGRASSRSPTVIIFEAMYKPFWKVLAGYSNGQHAARLPE